MPGWRSTLVLSWPRGLSYALTLCSAAVLVLLIARLAAERGEATDLYPRWYGLRALLLQGRNPYDPSVSREIAAQTWFFGGNVSQLGPATPLETAFGFLYPLPGALLLAPLALLPYPVALAAWLLFGLLALPAAAWLVVDASRPVVPLARPLAIPLALLFLPTWANLILAQPAAAVVFLLAVALWLATRRNERWPAALGAGAALAAAAALKPHLVFPIVLCWLGTHVWRWRGAGGAAASAPSRRFVVGAGAGTGALSVPAFLLVPTWPLDFARAAVQYYPVVPHPPALAALLLAVLPLAAAWVCFIAGAAALLWWSVAGWRIAGGQDAQPRGLASTALAVVLLIPPAWETNAVLLLLPLATTLGEVRTRRAAALFVAACAAVTALDLPLFLTIGWANGPLLAGAYATVLVVKSGWPLQLWFTSARSSPTPAAAAPSAPG